MDAAQAAEIFARRQKMSNETIRYATELKLDAERKLGEILRDTPKATGGQPYQSTGAALAPVAKPAPTLADLGISKKTSARAQKLAGLSEETLELMLCDSLAHRPITA